MKFYFVKYALTTGITEERGEKYKEKYAKIEGRHGLMTIGRDVFTDRDAANRAAKKLVDKKIASLKKQLKKMQDLKSNPGKMWVD